MYMQTQNTSTNLDVNASAQYHMCVQSCVMYENKSKRREQVHQFGMGEDEYSVRLSRLSLEMRRLCNEVFKIMPT